MQSPAYSTEYEATNTHNKYFDIGESKNIKTTKSKLLYKGSQSDTHTHTHTHTHRAYHKVSTASRTVKHSFRHNYSGYSKGQRTSHIKNCTPYFVYIHILFSFIKTLRNGKNNKRITGRNIQLSLKMAISICTNKRNK